MMQGPTTDYVTLIRRALHESLDDGFRVLRELMQNADDAKTRVLVFGHHAGFPDDALHPLLKGPGLWFFNDGGLKRTDAAALRSFGINSKAGDASTIGKFGLGMKSVFHLCEALFYVAYDGTGLHREGLAPWKSDGPWPHPEWDETDDADWNRLTNSGRRLESPDANGWFGNMKKREEWPHPRYANPACRTLHHPLRRPVCWPEMLFLPADSRSSDVRAIPGMCRRAPDEDRWIWRSP